MVSRSFEPDTQPTGVGTGGTTVAIPIAARGRFKLHPIDRLDITQDSGTATAVSWKLYETSDKNEADLIAEDSDATLPVHVQAGDGGWSWDSEKDPNDEVHLEITPDQGSDNDFTVRVIIDKGE